MTVTVQDIQDILAGTLEDLDAPNWQSHLQNLVNYPGFEKLIQGERVKQTAGDRISRRVRFDGAKNFKAVGLYGTDAPAVKDGLQTAYWDWAFTTNNWSMDYTEPLLQGGDARNTAVKLADIAEQRREDAMVDEAETWEDWIWSKPTDPDDNLRPHGVFSYIVVPSGTIAGNVTTLSGGNPANFTDGVGFNSDATTTKGKWKNRQGTFSAFDQDCLDTIKHGVVKTKFKVPPRVSQGHAHNAPSNMCQFYMGSNAMISLETLLVSQNDNVGADLAQYHGKGMFLRSKLNFVDQLDDYSDDRILQIDWSVMEFCALRGRFFKQHKPMIHPNQHSVLVVHMDSAVQLICTERRRLAAYAKV